MPAMNPDLHFRNIWLIIGYLLIALVVYLSLTSEPVMLDTRLPYEDKIMHALAYFTLMFWFGQIFHSVRTVILWAAGFIVMGLVLEYLQSFDARRYSEVADMTANNIGVVVAYLLVKTDLRNLLVRIERRLLPAGTR